MNFNKKSIDKISDNKLEWLLKNQSMLKNVPDDVNNKIINYYNNKNYNPKLKRNLFHIKNLKVLALAACFIIITGITLYFLKSYVYKKNSLYCKIIQSEGDITINNKKYTDSLNNKYILMGKTIKTEKNSKINFIIGNNSSIELNEYSQINILHNKKDKNGEYNKIYLINGRINCSVQLPTTQSKFVVITDFALFSVKGTKFNIEKMDNNDIFLDVKEGIVEISNYINIYTDLNIIKNKYKDIYNELLKIKNIKTYIKKGESITLKNDLIKEYNKKQNEFIKETISAIKSKKQLNDNEIKTIKNKIITFIKEGNEILKYSKESEENKKNIIKEDIDKNLNSIIIKKISSTPNIKLSESNTAVTSDDKNIYVSSGINKTVYCINHYNGNLKWVLKDKRIKNIISPAFPFKDKIILSTPDNIVIIDMNGKISEIKDIPIGTNYWASPIIIKNSIYIPTFDNIYKYNGKDIILIDALQTNSQIYINNNSQNIYYSILNEKKIKIYDINKKTNIWESSKFLERAFMPPVILNNYLYIGDVKGNIYKYNITSNLVTNIKNQTGLISDMTYTNGYLYFIANDGFFYRINTKSFKNIEKKTQVDNNPDSNKYLIKKLILNDNMLYFCSDTGKIFIYDAIKDKTVLLNIPENVKNLPLIGNPIVINSNVFFIDVEFNIYILTR